MNLKQLNKAQYLLVFYFHLLILLNFFSFSVNANELWTRYQFVNLELPASAHVNAFYEDQLGQIWVGSDNGLYRIHNNKIQKVNHGPKTVINDILQTVSNDMWLATNEGVWLWQSQTNKFSILDCTQNQSYSQLIKHPKLGLLALSRTGVFQLATKQTCTQVLFDDLPDNAPIERVALYNQNLILAVRGQGIFQCLNDCSKVRQFSPELINKRVREIVTHNNTLYAGTHKHGFYALNNQGEVQRHWHKNADIEPIDQKLPVNGVMSILPTKQSIWAGLWAGGLHQFETKSGNKISSSRFYAPDPTTIGGRHVQALLQSNNDTFYVGHENGISIILPAYNQQGWIGLANDSQLGFTNDFVISLYHHNNSWITGTSSGGLYHVDNTDNKLLRLSPESPPPFNFPTKSVWHISDSQSGDVLLGTSYGVIRLNPSTLEWQAIGDPSTYMSTDVYSLTEAPDQTIWLSLWEGGIVRLDKEGKLIGQWSQNDGLQQNTSTVIESTGDNQIYVLNNSGLFHYNYEQDKFELSEIQNKSARCSEIDHISRDLEGQLWVLCQHKSIWRLIEDDWVSVDLPTSKPIFNLFSASINHQPNKEQMYLLTENHILAIDINGKLIWQKTRLPITDSVTIQQAIIANNELIAATNQGLYRQKLSQSSEIITPSAPLISGVRLFNKTWEINQSNSQSNHKKVEATLYQGQLQLNYDQDLITFEFAMPGYHHEPLQGFNYRLTPFDNRWQTTAEEEAQATYTRIPPGKYLFEAKAIASIELPIATFQLEILPPWYLTWWAKTLAVLALITGVFAIIVGRTRRLKQSNIWLQESVDARTAELEQANDKLQQAANFDALTGLLNRRGFFNLCDPNWKLWQDQIIIMIADIDHFKRVNDQYGHQIGDEVLVTCAQRLQEKAGEHDLIARWGGEEFLILIRDDPKSTIDNLKYRAQLLQKVIGETPMELSSKKLKVTMTAGICEHQGEHFEKCLQQADQKLFKGKNSGRNKLIL